MVQSGGTSPKPGTPVKRRRKRIGSTNKLRARLPPIEAYEKELEFQAEGPGRVIVRLERLMGTDRVRLTDTKYMSTLLERLEEEERVAWTKRRLARIKTERNRFRKLAIDGLMEPGADMQDLIHHPVFRVNRILNRMAQFESQLTPAPPRKLPPITEVDPFAYDDTGKIFRSYPSHLDLQKELQRADFVRTSTGGGSISRRGSPKSSLRKSKESRQTVDTYVSSRMSSMEMKGLPSATSSKEVQQERPKPAASRKYHTLKASRLEFQSLGEMQEEYGVVTQTDLFREYEPYQAPLVQTVFEENGQNLYRTAQAVLEVYNCEQKAADAFVKRHRLK